MPNKIIEEKRRGLMLVMSSPSGAGKSTASPFTMSDAGGVEKIL